MQKLIDLYKTLTLYSPFTAWMLVIAILAGAVYFAQQFKLDASADSLVLENDADLRYYREVRARYGSDDFLVVTLTPKGDLFAPPVLDELKQLSAELEQLERVSSVTSILNVPLIDSPRTSLSELQKHIRTLEDPDTDPELARQEFKTSPFYRNLLVSPSGKTTAMLVNFKRNARYQNLLDQRDALWIKDELNADEQAQLAQLNDDIKQFNAKLQNQMQADLASVREILQKYRANHDIHIGGVPMVASDMIDFIRSDINTFGVTVGLFIVILLAVAFQRIRWVLVPVIICTTVVVVMTGFLGLMDWRVSVVSSNYVSLLLITSLALTVHLIVRHQELHASNPTADQRSMVEETLRNKLAPSFYTAATTMVAFASLAVSDLRPVMDFGWMMVVGVAFAFIFAFILFPALLAPFSPGTPVFRKHDVTAVITRNMANFIERFSNPLLLVYALILVLSLIGLTRLTVENRFIDYFKESTEIHQGMLLIDKKLGGTTPLDVIIDAPERFFEASSPSPAESVEAPPPSTSSEDEDDDIDFLEELYAEKEQEQDMGLSGSSYWYNIFQLKQVEAVHDYLDSLPETGKVLSLATTMKMVEMLNDDKALDNFSLAVMHKKLPDMVKETLFEPYMSEDGNQVRFSIRIIDSDKNLQRDELIKKIRRDLTEKFDLNPQQVHLSGMLVLYNNVLQSLFRSQILTLAAVFFAIMIMLIALFRSLSLALLGIVPTMMAAGLILGLMGWLGIPLDIMTITIAAITIGIGVDNTIHYVHRFQEEINKNGDGRKDYWSAVRRCHASVGRAIYYTSVTVTLGFSILALSNFIPTIYFGLLTGLAMFTALVANLTLLPLLLVKFKPL
jgi:predicted RND superfamily exporter protein